FVDSLTTRPTTSTLFPYTTLFRSHQSNGTAIHRARPRDHVIEPGMMGPRVECSADRCGHQCIHRHQPEGKRRQPQHASRRSAKIDRKSTRLNSSHRTISYAVFCLK